MKADRGALIRFQAQEGVCGPLQLASWSALRAEKNCSARSNLQVGVPGDRKEGANTHQLSSWSALRAEKSCSARTNFQVGASLSHPSHCAPSTLLPTPPPRRPPLRLKAVEGALNRFQAQGGGRRRGRAPVERTWNGVSGRAAERKGLF